MVGDQEVPCGALVVVWSITKFPAGRRGACFNSPHFRQAATVMASTPNRFHAQASTGHTRVEVAGSPRINRTTFILRYANLTGALRRDRTTPPSRTAEGRTPTGAGD